MEAFTILPIDRSARLRVSAKAHPSIAALFQAAHDSLKHSGLRRLQGKAVGGFAEHHLMVGAMCSPSGGMTLGGIDFSAEMAMETGAGKAPRLVIELTAFEVTKLTKAGDMDTAEGTMASKYTGSFTAVMEAWPRMVAYVQGVADQLDGLDGIDLADHG